MGTTFFKFFLKVTKEDWVLLNILRSLNKKKILLWKSLKQIKSNSLKKRNVFHPKRSHKQQQIYILLQLIGISGKASLPRPTNPPVSLAPRPAREDFHQTKN